jgi:sec-independent protein translocase protein TatA
MLYIYIGDFILEFAGSLNFFLLLRRNFMFEGLFRPMHLLVILFIVLIIFGPGRLPEIGEGLGKSIRSFKKAMTEKDDLKDEHMSIEQKEEKKA